MSGHLTPPQNTSISSCTTQAQIQGENDYAILKVSTTTKIIATHYQVSTTARITATLYENINPSDP